MNASQQINITVVNAPLPPDAGATSLFDGFAMPSVTLALAISLIILVPIVIRLARRGRRKLALGVSSMMILSSLVFTAGVSPHVLAASALTLGQPKVDITVVKNDAQATTKTATSTTNVTTNNTTGYTMSAGLQAALPAGITANINNEDLTTTAVDIYADNTGTSPSDYDHDLSVTVPAGTPVGQYTFYIDYAITENAPNAPTTMQGMTRAYCNSMSLNETITLNDPRGAGQEYRVRKLADGNCWMINNLKLGSTGGTLALTSTDTNIPGNYTLPQVGASGTNSYTAGVVNGPITGQNNDLTSSAFYGYLYNYCAVTANATATCAGNLPSATVASSDICPAGWRLPRGGAVNDVNNEFSQLNAKMAGFADNQNATYQVNPGSYYSNFQHDGPFSGVLAGWKDGATVNGTGAYGMYWSANANAGYQVYGVVLLNGAQVQTGFAGPYRTYRTAVRCVLN
ncbi:MAG: hypothetical protein LBG75_01685 [Candidatus Nomurabacteria bacterium]|nr:hypothetical protein [Candidatus Nomurabacteria bacterium]